MFAITVAAARAPSRHAQAGPPAPPAAAAVALRRRAAAATARLPAIAFVRPLFVGRTKARCVRGVSRARSGLGDTPLRPTPHTSIKCRALPPVLVVSHPAQSGSVKVVKVVKVIKGLIMVENGQKDRMWQSCMVWCAAAHHITAKGQMVG